VGRDDDVAKATWPFFAALQIDGSGHGFVAVERAAGDAGDFLIVDNPSCRSAPP